MREVMFPCPNCGKRSEAKTQAILKDGADRLIRRRRRCPVCRLRFITEERIPNIAEALIGDDVMQAFRREFKGRQRQTA